MQPDGLFEIWAPASSVWSPWAKPVLFTQGYRSITYNPANEEASAPLSINADFEPKARTAIIVDLPGSASIRYGLGLAALGFRPVPLFNGVSGPSEAVSTGELVAGLGYGASLLAKVRIDDAAPPAFLLDARRLAGGARPKPRTFDNRWMTFPQDFPSASFLLSRGIDRAVLVNPDGRPPQDDLKHVLLRWQQTGIEIRRLSDSGSGFFERIEITRPRLFRVAWYRILMTLGLRRNSAGGFGSVVPEPSDSGSGYHGGFG